MFPGPIRVLIARFRWRVVSEDATRMRLPTGSLYWDTAFLDAVFQGSNGWSVRDYWLRTTFGLMDLRFEIGPGGWILERDQTALRDDRGGVIAACRSAAEAKGQSLTGFDRVVCFVNPPPCNAGAVGSPGDVLLDQGGSLEMFQHEVGHLLGFDHAWGRSGPYDDPYCVMGFTNPQARPIARPAEFSNVITFADPFWRSGRRVSAASLYHLFVQKRFGGMGDLRFGDGAAGGFERRVIHTRLGRDVWVASLSQARGSPVIAVAPIPSGGVLTVEYRTAAGDDAGVKPAVVVHTLGSRSIGPGHHERDPPWFEVALPAYSGQGATIAIGGRGYRVDVIERSDDGVPSVRVSLRGSFRVAEYPHQQPGWRWCRNCQGVAFAFGSKVGECPAGGTHDHGESGVYSVLRTYAAPSPVQGGWRWCAKCDGLVFAAGPPSPCPAGGGHDHSASGHYHLLHGVEPMIGQPGWRWCGKCQIVASGADEPGPCAAGGTHDHSASGNYSMLRNVSLITAQAGWRACDKCKALVFGGTTPRPCSGGGTHKLSLADDYSVLHDLVEPTSQDNWRNCSKCQGLVFGGSVEGTCPSGGTHALSAGDNYRLLHGLQITQAGWRWCTKCQGLAFSGDAPGSCPSGGKHDHSGSGDYTMLPEPPHVWP